LYGDSWSVIDRHARVAPEVQRLLRGGLGEEGDPVALEAHPHRHGVRRAGRHQRRHVAEVRALEQPAYVVADLGRHERD